MHRFEWNRLYVNQELIDNINDYQQIKFRKKEEYHTVGTFTQPNRQIADKIDTPSTYIHDRLLSWLTYKGTVTTKHWELKLVVWVQICHLSEMMWSSRYILHFVKCQPYHISGWVLFLKGSGGSMSWVAGLPNNSYMPITNTVWVRARLCKLQKRVHSTHSHK